MYMKRGLVKVQLGVARGKTFGDKRETLKKKQADLEARREIGEGDSVRVIKIV